ncbi:hypothetical protein RIF29_00865 [Crotalaria pallida]|uniref:Uncharacterized protein n=1 Tax=Crotalaria pallida TaxID=3830 RepID=A0AAN9P7S9_CROPI
MHSKMYVILPSSKLSFGKESNYEDSTKVGIGTLRAGVLGKESVSNRKKVSLGATVKLLLSGQEVTGSNPGNNLSACRE